MYQFQYTCSLTPFHELTSTYNRPPHVEFSDSCLPEPKIECIKFHQGQQKNIPCIGTEESDFSSAVAVLGLISSL